MATWSIVTKGVLTVIRCCNSYCSKEKKDAEESEIESDSDEKAESIPMTKNKKKKSTGLLTKHTTNQNTVNPTINISVNAGPLPTSVQCPAPTEPASPLLAPLSLPLNPESIVHWILSNNDKVSELKDVAVVGGYDYDGSELWVIRTVFESELIPAKLNYRTKQAYVAYEQTEHVVDVYEVCCAPAENIKWIECSHGEVPSNAVVGGRTKSGDKLYIGRALQGTSWCPGKILPSDGVLYVSYAYEVHAHQFYEVMCII